MTVADQKSDRPILVPIDFSNDSKAALRWASDQATHRARPLVVLHVIHDPLAAPGLYSPAPDETLPRLGRLRDAASEMFERFLVEIGLAFEVFDLDSVADSRAPVRSLLVDGLPVQRILEVAERLDSDHIIMGSRGLTGFPHLLLGSKAQKVVQLAAVPVTIVKSQPEIADSTGRREH